MDKFKIGNSCVSLSLRFCPSPTVVSSACGFVTCVASSEETCVRTLHYPFHMRERLSFRRPTHLHPVCCRTITVTNVPMSARSVIFPPPAGYGQITATPSPDGAPAPPARAQMIAAQEAGMTLPGVPAVFEQQLAPAPELWVCTLSRFSVYSSTPLETPSSFSSFCTVGTRHRQEVDGRAHQGDLPAVWCTVPLRIAQGKTISRVARASRFFLGRDWCLDWRRLCEI